MFIKMVLLKWESSELKNGGSSYMIICPGHNLGLAFANNMCDCRSYEVAFTIADQFLSAN